MTKEGRIKLGSQGLEVSAQGLGKGGMREKVEWRQKVEFATKFESGTADGKFWSYRHHYCRIDTRVSVETSRESKKLVEKGKIKNIGPSEASASTIKRAHAVHQGNPTMNKHKKNQATNKGEKQAIVRKGNGIRKA